MATSEPFPAAFLSSILPIVSLQFDLQRFEEISGSGSGQFWSAQMAPPLWQVTLSLAQCRVPLAREINAKVKALGTTKSMNLVDPSYGPASGMASGASAAVSTINANRTALAISGLSSGYRVTAGDRLSISIGGNSVYFGEFVETAAANGAGTTSQITVNPPLPFAVVAGSAVKLGAPVLRCRVPPGGFTPYSWQLGDYASGASLTLVQKK